MISWSAVERLFSVDGQLFTAPEVDKLVTAVGHPLLLAGAKDALAVALSNAVATYGFDLWRQGAPNPSEIEAQAQLIASQCKTLLGLVGITGVRSISPASIFPSLARGGLFAAAAAEGAESGEQAVLDALLKVEDLKRWAEHLAVIAVKRQLMRGRPRTGRKENRALNILLAELTRLYESAWAEPAVISASRDRGSPDEADNLRPGSMMDRAYQSGEPLPKKFHRFLCEVADCILNAGIPAPETPAAIAQAWRRSQPRLLTE